MVANQTVYSSFEQRSIIKFSVAEKSKPCEIYRRMCDVYREECFSQKMFTNMGLTLRNQSQKDSTWRGKSSRCSHQ